MSNIGPHIIVKRSGRGDVRDLAVFTGSMNIEATQKQFVEGVPWLMPRADVSDKLEHAYIFPDAAQATRWAERLMPDWCEETGRFIPFTWVVRKYPDFTPGQYNPRNIDVKLGVSSELAAFDKVVML